MNQNKAMGLAGGMWCCIGVTLLVRGLSFIQMLMENNIQGPLVNFLSRFSLSQAFSTPIILLLIGVLIGFIKGNTVLKKAAEKNIVRLIGMEKIALWNIFPVSGWAIMLVMMVVGMMIKMLGISPDVRGVVLVAVGSALIQGGMTYFTGIVRQILMKS